MDIKNLTRAGIGQGLLMGWGDEAEAFARSKATGRPYKEELAKVRTEYGNYAKSHPIQSTGAELAGGFLPLATSYLATAGTEGAAAPTAAATTAKTVGVLNRLKSLLSNPVVRGATTGATTGAVAGAGSATEGNKVSGAVGNALVGAGLGAAVPAVVRGGKSASSWLAERLIPTEKTVEKHAASKINRALKESSKKPSDISKAIAKDRKMNVPSVVANTDPALVDLAETVAQRSGPSARAVESKLAQQTTGAKERVYGQVRKGLHPGEFYEDEQRLINDLRKNAATAYDDAYAFGSVDDPRINEVLKNPQFKAFFDRAKNIANSEALAAKLRGEDPSKYKLREVLETLPDGSIKLREIPDVRTLDYIKRGIDATIDSGFRGQGMSTAEANALKDLRNVFTGVIDEATTVNGNSLYGSARKVYSGDMETLNALRAGMNDFGKMDHEEVIKLISGMNDSEKQAFRTGVVRDIYSKIMNPSGNINAAQRIIGSPEMQVKLQPLFDSPSHFNVFRAALEREAQLFQQSNRILGGAATGRRIQARERFEEEPGVSQAISDAIIGGPWNSLTNLASRFARKATMSDDVANKVATMLMSSEPKEVAAAVKLLEDYGQKAESASRRLQATEFGLSGGVPIAAPVPPEGSKGPSIEQETVDIPREPKGQSIESAIEADEKRNIPGVIMTAPKQLGPGIE